jgi:aminomethyltransferase
VVNGATKHDDIAHLRANLPEAVSLTHLADSALFALQGPEAFAALARWGGEHALSALSFMRGASFTLGGVDAWISRSGYTGEDGFEIAVPAERRRDRRPDLRATASEADRPGRARSLRLEAGLPLYGHDMTPDVDPVSADLFGINKRRRGDGAFPARTASCR